MFRIFNRRQDNARPLRAKSAQPRLEGLEDRLLLYAAETSWWAYPARVTFSLVADGTSIGGTPSNLYATMNSYLSTATWQADLAKAAATWEGAAKVNLVQVSDDGSAIGSGNYLQGSPTIGDIRIGAMPEAAGTLALTYLLPGGGATAIVFNSNANWGSTGYDLTTVALHEFGHALGLDESAVSGAAMYPNYSGVIQTLSTDDVSGIDSLYGARVSAGNTTYTNATPITLNGSYQATVTDVQIASATDQNWYSVVVPSGTSGTLTVTMQSSNLSSLDPRLTLYSDVNGTVKGLAQASSTSYGATVTVVLNGVSAGQTYLIRATANASGAGSAGAYGLTVNAGTGTMPAISPPNTTVSGTPKTSNSAPEVSDGYHADSPAGSRHPHHVTVASRPAIGESFVVKVRNLRHSRVHH